MEMTRRDVLRLIGVSAGVAAGLTALGACSQEPSAGLVSGAGEGTARTGGTVRLAFVGSGAMESLNPFAAYSPADLARSLVLFDRLFVMQDGKPTGSLAVSAKPAPDAMSFELTLREGVRWHDGTPLTAADVVYSFRQLPANPLFASELAPQLDIAGISATAERTVRVPTLRPLGFPAEVLASAAMTVVKDGATAFGPGSLVGTGAYRLAGFEPGKQARLTRNDEYWGGPPKADELVVLSIDDPQTRANAVEGGQADYASDIPFVLARAGARGDNVEIRTAGDGQRTGYGFILNTTKPLLADARVRKALRLTVDRKSLVDRVFLGYGTPGNDLFGRGTQYYADDIAAPNRDIDRARALLSEAGAAGAPLVVRSGEYETGLNSSTELFVEQLRAIGLDAKAEIVPPTAYFDPAGITAADALAFPLGPFPLSLIYNRASAFPSLAFRDPELEAAMATAASTVEETERARAWRTAQQVMADRGNWIVWGFGDVLSLVRKDLVGFQVRESAKYPYLGTVGFRE